MTLAEILWPNRTTAHFETWNMHFSPVHEFILKLIHELMNT